MSANEAWLASTQEEILDPGMPICDPHHHLWDRNGDVYLAEDLLKDLGSGHRVTSTIFVEARSAYRTDGPESLRVLGETEFVRRTADACDASGTPVRVAAGIVGHANLMLGADIVPVLEAQLEAGGKRFKGIRHSAAWDHDPAIRRSASSPGFDMMLDPTFRQGFAQLGRFGLSFDAWLYHPQIPGVVDLARTFPGTTIVVDHFGGPLGVGPYAGRSDEVFSTWRAAVAPLAALPNVVMKLGGLNMEVNGFGWHLRPAPPSSGELAEATRRYFAHAIELLGPARCMFESNFPVDKLSCSYAVLWNSFKRLAAGLRSDQQEQLFHGTAERVYRLESIGHS